MVVVQDADLELLHVKLASVVPFSTPLLTLLDLEMLFRILDLDLSRLDLCIEWKSVIAELLRMRVHHRPRIPCILAQPGSTFGHRSRHRSSFSKEFVLQVLCSRGVRSTGVGSRVLLYGFGMRLSHPSRCQILFFCGHDGAGSRSDKRISALDDSSSWCGLFLSRLDIVLNLGNHFGSGFSHVVVTELTWWRVTVDEFGSHIVFEDVS